MYIFLRHLWSNFRKKSQKASAIYTVAYISHATLIVLTVAETLDYPDFYHRQANVAEDTIVAHGIFYVLLAWKYQ